MTTLEKEYLAVMIITNGADSEAATIKGIVAIHNGDKSLGANDIADHLEYCVEIYAPGLIKYYKELCSLDSLEDMLPE